MEKTGRRELAPYIPSEGPVPFGSRIRAARWHRGIWRADCGYPLYGIFIAHEPRWTPPKRDIYEQMRGMIGFSQGDLLAIPNLDLIEWIKKVRPEYTGTMDIGGLLKLKNRFKDSDTPAEE